MQETFSLSHKSKAIINKYMATGNFINANEVIEQGLALLEKEEKQIKVLREAIRAGEKSGVAEDFNLETFRNRIYSDYSE